VAQSLLIKKSSQKKRRLQKLVLSLHRKHFDMEIRFEKKYLSELYYNGQSNDKNYRFQPQVVRKYQRCIDLLEGATSIETLYQYNALNYKILKGDKAGISSVRINDQYRIEFTVTKVETETFVTVCNILELSNHYK
jgi:proteic killer suppression protein